MHPLGQHASDEVLGLAETALHVLVIDDDDCVGAAIKAILARRNSETKLTSRAYAGIKALEVSRFDVVLVDIFMPGMSGLNAIAHIRRQSEIPIIAMSGFRLRDTLNSIDYLGMAMQRGASACISKPFSPHQLIEVIDQSVLLAMPTTGAMQ